MIGITNQYNSLSQLPTTHSNRQLRAANGPWEVSTMTRLYLLVLLLAAVAYHTQADVSCCIRKKTIFETRMLSFKAVFNNFEPLPGTRDAPTRYLKCFCVANWIKINPEMSIHMFVFRLRITYYYYWRQRQIELWMKSRKSQNWRII